MTNIHFLHIGKTGGTAIKFALGPIAQKHSIVLHEHRIRLRDVPEEEPVFFFIRNPLTRFVSGFNSRLRRGLPRYFSPWNSVEAWAFESFPSASCLGEGLSDPDAARKEQARSAMTGIDHVGLTYGYWFSSFDELRERNGPSFVGLQEHLDKDFERLKLILGLPQDLALPNDAVAKHSTPAEFDTNLSDRAKVNLYDWFANDVSFYEACKELRRSQLGFSLEPEAEESPVGDDAHAKRRLTTDKWTGLFMLL